MGIQYNALHCSRSVVSGKRSHAPVIVLRHSYAAPIRVQQELLGIKSHSPLRIEGAVNSISINLPRLQSRNIHMPIIQSSAVHSLDRNYAGGLRIVDAIEQKQLHAGRIPRKDAEIHPARNDCGGTIRTPPCATLLVDISLLNCI